MWYSICLICCVRCSFVCFRFLRFVFSLRSQILHLYNSCGCRIRMGSGCCINPTGTSGAKMDEDSSRLRPRIRAAGVIVDVFELQRRSCCETNPQGMTIICLPFHQACPGHLLQSRSQHSPIRSPIYIPSTTSVLADAPKRDELCGHKLPGRDAHYYCKYSNLIRQCNVSSSYLTVTFPTRLTQCEYHSTRTQVPVPGATAVSYCQNLLLVVQSGVRHRVSVQVDPVGMFSELLTF